MFASAFADLDHTLNFVMAVLFPVAGRLIAGVPFTLIEYAIGYVAGVIILYSFDYRNGLLTWALERLRGKAQ